MTTRNWRKFATLHLIEEVEDSRKHWNSDIEYLLNYLAVNAHMEGERKAIRDRKDRENKLLTAFDELISEGKAVGPNFEHVYRRADLCKGKGHG